MYRRVTALVLSAVLIVAADGSSSSLAEDALTPRGGTILASDDGWNSVSNPIGWVALDSVDAFSDSGSWIIIRHGDGTSTPAHYESRDASASELREITATRWRNSLAGDFVQATSPPDLLAATVIETELVYIEDASQSSDGVPDLFVESVAGFDPNGGIGSFRYSEMDSGRELFSYERADAANNSLIDLSRIPAAPELWGIPESGTTVQAIDPDALDLAQAANDAVDPILGDPFPLVVDPPAATVSPSDPGPVATIDPPPVGPYDLDPLVPDPGPTTVDPPPVGGVDLDPLLPDPGPVTVDPPILCGEPSNFSPPCDPDPVTVDPPPVGGIDLDPVIPDPAPVGVDPPRLCGEPSNFSPPCDPDPVTVDPPPVGADLDPLVPDPGPISIPPTTVGPVDLDPLIPDPGPMTIDPPPVGADLDPLIPDPGPMTIDPVPDPHSAENASAPPPLVEWVTCVAANWKDIGRCGLPPVGVPDPCEELISCESPPDPCDLIKCDVGVCDVPLVCEPLPDIDACDIPRACDPPPHPCDLLDSLCDPVTIDPPDPCNPRNGNERLCTVGPIDLPPTTIDPPDPCSPRNGEERLCTIEQETIPGTTIDPPDPCSPRNGEERLCTVEDVDPSPITVNPPQWCNTQDIGVPCDPPPITYDPPDPCATNGPTQNVLDHCYIPRVDASPVTVNPPQWCNTQDIGVPCDPPPITYDPPDPCATNGPTQNLMDQCYVPRVDASPVTVNPPQWCNTQDVGVPCDPDPITYDPADPCATNGPTQNVLDHCYIPRVDASPVTIDPPDPCSPRNGEEHLCTVEQVDIPGTVVDPPDPCEPFGPPAHLGVCGTIDIAPIATINPSSSPSTQPTSSPSALCIATTIPADLAPPQSVCVPPPVPTVCVTASPPAVLESPPPELDQGSQTVCVPPGVGGPGGIPTCDLEGATVEESTLIAEECTASVLMPTPERQVLVADSNVIQANWAKACNAGKVGACNPVKRAKRFALRIKRLAQKPSGNNDGMGYAPDIILLQETNTAAADRIVRDLNSMIEIANPLGIGDPVADPYELAISGEATDEDLDGTPNDGKILVADGAIIYNVATMVKGHEDHTDTTYNSGEKCTDPEEGQPLDIDYDGLDDCGEQSAKSPIKNKRHFLFDFFERRPILNDVLDISDYRVAVATVHLVHPNLLAPGEDNTKKEEWSRDIATDLVSKYPGANGYIIGGDFNTERCVHWENEVPGVYASKESPKEPLPCTTRSWWNALSGLGFTDSVFLNHGSTQPDIDGQYNDGCEFTCNDVHQRNFRIDFLFGLAAAASSASHDLTCGTTSAPPGSRLNCDAEGNPETYSDHRLVWSLHGS